MEHLSSLPLGPYGEIPPYLLYQAVVDKEPL